jgi:hypothetical protein
LCQATNYNALYSKSEAVSLKCNGAQLEHAERR